MRARLLPTLPDSPPRSANCRLRGACGGSAGPASLPQAALQEKARNHPCYSEDAHHHFARMHVAVAPACNIQCNYCNRKFDCANESRPGVVSERLTPEEAMRKVLAVAAAVPQLSVVGIAGPGDPLANVERTFTTMELVKRALPDVKLCLSTNGLALPENAERLLAAGVEHVTVTVNTLDPEIGARIHPWVVVGGRRVSGREGAAILSERQLEGIARLATGGALVKVNTVLIPGVNDRDVAAVSRRVRALGAFVHNVMPLIAAPEHGTHYGLTGQRGPTREELERVQEACADGVTVMRHCRQCRADAVGLLGEDRGQEFTVGRLPAVPADGAGARRAHRELVERQRAANGRAAEEARALVEASVAARPAAAPPFARVAVATRGAGLVNQHFGHASEFQVYEASRRGVRLLGVRKVEHYCDGAEGADDVLDGILRAVSDCSAVLVAKVGRCPRERLREARIEVVDRYAFEPIHAAVLAWFAGHPGRATSAGPRHSSFADVA